MKKNDCIIVRAAGRQLDALRSEASRIAKANNIDWWVERTDKGAQFCFEGADLKQRFAASCENLGIPHQEA